MGDSTGSSSFLKNRTEGSRDRSKNRDSEFFDGAIEEPKLFHNTVFFFFFFFNLKSRFRHDATHNRVYK